MLATTGMMLATPVQAHGNHHQPIHHHASHKHVVHGGQRHKAYSRGYRKGYRRALRSIEPTVVRVYRPFIRPARPIVVAPHHSWLNVGIRFPL